LKNGPEVGPFFGLTREAGNLSILSIVTLVHNLRDFRNNFDTIRKDLVELLRELSLVTGGPFTLASGELSDWYLDGRKTFMDGRGALLVGRSVLGVLDRRVQAVGGMTMGADPISIATTVVAAEAGIDLQAFSVRKQAKGHGLGGRLVGPVRPGNSVAVLEDTTTTGAAMLEAIAVTRDAGLEVLQAIAIADRSEGKAADRIEREGIPFLAITTAAELLGR
jgi:orotate phosphoribosyltransferase